MPSIVPIGQNVILEIITEMDKLADRYKSTLIIETTSKTVQGQPNTGRVYVISPDIKDPDYKVGDMVVFHTEEVFQGFKMDGKNLVTVKHNEIIASINEEAK